VRSQIKLGRLFGIQIGLHYSWFLIALLIVMSLARYFRAGHAQWPAIEVYSLAVVSGILFFVSLLLHELSHSLVAKMRGIPVKEITLFALGGVSQIEGEPSSAKSEFWMAVVGPVTSTLIGLACLGIVGVLGVPISSPAGTMFSWLGYINLVLAVFNLLPGYPLDGGRILRAAAWWKTGDVDHATRIAARAGQAVAGVFIALGIFGYFGGGGLGALWIAFIGWFLLQAAGESYTRLTLRHALENVQVKDVMSEDYLTAEGRLSVQEFVDHELLRTGRRCFIVLEDGALAGLITPQEIRSLDRSQWPHTQIREIMRPRESVRGVSPDLPLSQALELMSREDLNQLPVISNGVLQGMLSRADVLAFLQTRAELEIHPRLSYQRRMRPTST
jgi:Zn-dependent protease/predicted transcriptional regulator